MAQSEFTDFEVQIEGLDEMNAWGGEGFKIPEQGEYELRVVAVEQKTAASTQNPMVAVTFEVTKPLNDQAPDNVGLKVFNNYVLTPKALPRLKQLMVACGASLAGFRASEVMGQTIKATVIHNEGAAQIDESGNPRPSRTFANLINEQPLETAAPKVDTTKPPIMNKSAPVKNGAGARRA